MDTKKIETWKHQEDTFKLQREIMEHVKAIRSLEEKLVSLRTDDLCEDLDLESIPSQSLWRNLELIEKNPSSYSQTQQQFDEEPCYSTLDLVVQKLLHTPKSPLRMKGGVPSTHWVSPFSSAFQVKLTKMLSGKITNSVCLQLITSNINQKLHHN